MNVLIAFDLDSTLRTYDANRAIEALKARAYSTFASAKDDQRLPRTTVMKIVAAGTSAEIWGNEALGILEGAQQRVTRLTAVLFEDGDMAYFDNGQ